MYQVFGELSDDDDDKSAESVETSYCSDSDSGNSYSSDDIDGTDDCSEDSTDDCKCCEDCQDCACTGGAASDTTPDTTPDTTQDTDPTVATGSADAALPAEHVGPPKNYGASLMVFAVDPHHGLPWILLAREVAGKWCGGGCTFSDFGGSAEPTDADAEATAAREFCEESLFCVSVPGVTGPLKQRAQLLAEQLRDGDYLFRVNFPVTNRNAVYSMFVKQVEWQDDITSRFKQARRKLLRLRYGRNLTESDLKFVRSHPAFHMVGDRPALRRSYLEKVNVEPFSIAGLRRYFVLGKHNLLKDMHIMSRMRGNIRTACDLVESVFDSTDGAAHVRCNSANVATHFPATHKQLPTATDSGGHVHIGLSKKKYTLRVFATEPHAQRARPGEWHRTNYHGHSHSHTRATGVSAVFARRDFPNTEFSNWNRHFRKRNRSRFGKGRFYKSCDRPSTPRRNSNNSLKWPKLVPSHLPRPALPATPRTQMLARYRAAPNAPPPT